MKIDYAKVGEYVREHYADVVQSKHKIAEDVMANKFLFDSPNDLERTTETVTFDGDIDWEYVLNGDKEFAYQLARHRYFVDLAECYALEGKEEYVQCIVDIARQFLRNCPYKESSLAWRTLETGLRLEYWTRALDMISSSPLIDDTFKAEIEESMHVHAKVLISKKIDHHRLSNWGVLQDHGLLDAGIYLGEEKYVNIALERLYEEARLQVMADGVHWEVSATYHNEVLGCFVDAMLRSKDAGIELSPEFVSNVHKMARVNMYWANPNHMAPLYGDSDEQDLRGIMSITSYLLGDSELRAVAGDVVGYDYTWRIGMEGISEYETMAKTMPSHNSIALSDSACYIMRTDYSEDANYLIFHNGHTGGGHAHEDKLSFELNVGGRDIFVDTGRYTYLWNKERSELKSYRAHNTISVDNSHFVRAFGWDYIGDIARSLRSDMVITDEYELVQGTHLGYMNKGLKSGIAVTRTILWLKPDIYVILDEFTGKGMHMYSSFYNIAPGANVKVNGNSVDVRNGDASARLLLLDEGVKVTSEKGLYSAHYNAITDIDRIVASKRCKVGHNMTAVIVAHSERYGDLKVERVSVKDAYGHVLPETSALAITAGGKVYTIIAKYKEYNRLLLADDKPATGKLTIYIDDIYHLLTW